MLDKKPIKGLQIRKPITISRLIKCYVCNQHFQTQNLFDLHLQQHQNKFSKSSFQEMQGKTQESFRSKKSVPSLNRTQLIGPRSQTLSSLETLEKSQNAEKEQDLQEKEQREIAQALKESQILLEKIEFITQVNGKQQQETQPSQKDFDFEVIKKLIEGQRQLNFQINKAENKARIEELILETNFQQRYFENYQEQLLHLRLLASVAINPSSKAKINQIKDNICRDVCNQLQRHFAVQEVKKSSRRQKLEGAKLGENEGEIRNCVDCYGSIGGTDQYYSLSGGHCYHVECWKESAGE